MHHPQSADSTQHRSAQAAEDDDWAFLRRTTRPEAPPADADISIVDLFSGCGGLTIGALEGARRSGRTAKLSLAVDNDPLPLSVMEQTLKNHGAKFKSLDLAPLLARLAEPVLDSERELLGLFPQTTMLLAGPPCQGHSALNNHTRHDDPRNDLYLAVARVARLLDPEVVCIENVRGAGSDRRRSVERCAAALGELGYETTSRRLDLHQLGVPQTRVRHLLIATKERTFEWDLVSQPGRNVAWAIDDLVDSAESPTANRLDTASKPSAANAARIAWLFSEDKYDLPNPRRPKCHQSQHSYLSMYGRLRWHAPAQTVTSGYGSMGQGRYVHPLRPRTLTAHEAARLQFLPDFVQLNAIAMTRSAIAKMIGNAAPPMLTIALVQALVAQAFI